jgi:hypothetical protein
MLERLTVLCNGERQRRAQGAELGDDARGRTHKALLREFPSLEIAHQAAAQPHVRASEWQRRDFDSWRFDCTVDALAHEGATLCIDDDDGRPEFALEVMTRCQRHLTRRNRNSDGPLFARVLQHHRALHDLEKPLVRADFNHALDVWQWLLRLDSGVSLELQLAALFHDIERLQSEPDVRIEQHAPDYQHFKDAHAREGAAVTETVLARCGVDTGVRSSVTMLITAHERKSADPAIALLSDADALSFFSLNSPGYADYFGPAQTQKKVLYTLNRMSEGARARLATVHLREDVRGLVAAMGD